MRPAVRRAARLVRPFVPLARAAQRGTRLTLVGWHRVDDSGEPAATPVDVFRRQLDLLLERDAPVLRLDDAADLLAAGRLPAGAVALTFDDGYASVLETAWPLLRERRLPATLFAVSGYLGGGRTFPWDAAGSAAHSRVATADELRDAAREGLDIGSHTVNHRWLPRLDDAELAGELSESRAELAEVVGRPVCSLAYPMGGWDARVRAAAAAAGYRLGITVERGTNPTGRDPLTLRRAFAPATVADYGLLLAGAYTWLGVYDRWRRQEAPPW